MDMNANRIAEELVTTDLGLEVSALKEALSLLQEYVKRMDGNESVSPATYMRAKEFLKEHALETGVGPADPGNAIVAPHDGMDYSSQGPPSA